MAIPTTDTRPDPFSLRMEGAKDDLLGGVSTAALITTAVGSGGTALASPLFDIALLQAAHQMANGVYTGVVRAHGEKLKLNAYNAEHGGTAPSSTIRGGNIEHALPARAVERAHQ